MDAMLVVIENDAERDRAAELVSRLMDATEASDLARLEAQARLIQAYEQKKWPAEVPDTATIIAYLMDQHGLTRADMAALLGTESRVSEILNGRRRLSMSMVQRLRQRFHVSADVLIPANAPAAPERKVTKQGRSATRKKALAPARPRARA